MEFEKMCRTHAVSASIRGVPSLRDGPWKYIPAPGAAGRKAEIPSQPIQLYHLGEDPGETDNLAARMPEKVAEMKTRLDELIAQGRSTPGAPQQNDVKVVRYPK